MNRLVKKIEFTVISHSRLGDKTISRINVLDSYLNFELPQPSKTKRDYGYDLLLNYKYFDNFYDNLFWQMLLNKVVIKLLRKENYICIHNQT